jgi:hypothetical protein
MKIRSAITAVGAITALGAGALAFAPGAFADTSGTERFQITIANNNEAVVAHGLFTDAGSDETSNTNYDVLVLSAGEVRLTHPDSKVTYSNFHINNNTCFATITEQGAYTLGHGTGAYAGVHGHGTYNAKIQAVFAMSSGVCNGDSAPTGETGVINAHGPAFLPSTAL